jgi:hypothetical protein
MISKLVVEGGRAGDLDLELHQRTKISGRNGVGKSTILDLISFSLTGSTRAGVLAPVELIHPEKDKLKVSITLGDRTIERSLTQKKTQNLKVDIGNGVLMPFTQEQLNSVYAPRELMLAAVVAGYFGSLSDDRKLGILKYLMPAAPRSERLEQVTGLKIPAHLKKQIDEAGRTDQAKNVLSEFRRANDKEVSRLSGLIQAYENTKHPGDAPKEPEAPSAAIDDGLAAWNTHRRDLARWQTRKDQLTATFPQGVQDSLAVHDKKIAEIEQEIVGLSDEVVPADVRGKLTTLPQKVAELRAKQKPVPAKPSEFALTSADRCHACGQVVGLKHRETVRSKYEADLAAHMAGVQAVHDWNEKVSQEISAIMEELNEAKKQETDVVQCNFTSRQRIQVLQKELSKIKAVKIPEPLGEKPEPPQGLATEADLVESRRAWVDFHVAEGQYKHSLKQFEDAQKLHGIYTQKIEEIKNTGVKPIQTLEVACEEIDALALQEQEHALRFGVYKFAKTDFKVTVFDVRSGLTYESMSTGQKIACDIEICKKLSTLSNTSFILADNLDLISSPIDNDTLQIVGCFVDPAVDGVLIQPL